MGSIVIHSHKKRIDTFEKEAVLKAFN